MYLIPKFPLCYFLSLVSLPHLISGTGDACCSHSPGLVRQGTPPLISKQNGSCPFLVSVQLLLILGIDGPAGILGHMTASKVPAWVPLRLQKHHGCYFPFSNLRFVPTSSRLMLFGVSFLLGSLLGWRLAGWLMLTTNVRSLL